MRMGRKKYTQQNNLPTISTEPDFHLAVVAFGTDPKMIERSETKFGVAKEKVKD